MAKEKVDLVADMADMALRVEQQLQHFPHQHLQLGLNK
jgi:hypothetical protein